MRVRRLLLTVALAAVYRMLCLPGDGWATNRVVVESKAFQANQTGCQVGVFITNDVSITGAVFPLEIRSISGGAYVSDSFDFKVPKMNRLGNSPLGADPDSAGRWPGASVTDRRLAVIGFDTAFSAICGKFGSVIDTTHTFRRSAPQIDFVSPDAVLYVTISTGDPRMSEDIELKPGTDPPGTANASIIFRFGVNSSPGTFVVDTCCVTPANRLVFVTVDANPVHPWFIRGEISIAPCSCPCHADPFCDSVPSHILDVVTIIDIAFRGVPEIFDPDCPFSRSDVNCDDCTNVIDVVREVEVTLRGADPAITYCHPCS